jgi:hypothetical protein
MIVSFTRDVATARIDANALLVSCASLTAPSTKGSKLTEKALVVACTDMFDATLNVGKSGTRTALWAISAIAKVDIEVVGQSSTFRQITTGDTRNKNSAIGVKAVVVVAICQRFCSSTRIGIQSSGLSSKHAATTLLRCRQSWRVDRRVCRRWTSSNRGRMCRRTETSVINLQPGALGQFATRFAKRDRPVFANI